MTTHRNHFLRLWSRYIDLIDNFSRSGTYCGLLGLFKLFLKEQKFQCDV